MKTDKEKKVAEDFWKVIKILKSCKTFAQFTSAENVYDNFKKYHFGLSLYEYHSYDDLWDDVWDEVLDRIAEPKDD